MFFHEAGALDDEYDAAAGVNVAHHFLQNLALRNNGGGGNAALVPYAPASPEAPRSPSPGPPGGGGGGGDAPDAEPIQAPPDAGPGGGGGRGSGGNGGPPMRDFVAPPSQTIPRQRWGHVPLEEHHVCHACEFDQIMLGAQKNDVVATRWLRLMRYVQQLAANRSLDNYERTDKFVAAYNKFVRPVRVEVLQRARQSGTDIDERAMSEYHPLLAYEHVFSGHGHPSARPGMKRRRWQQRQENVAVDDDDVAAAMDEAALADEEEDERAMLRLTGGYAPSPDPVERVIAEYSESLLVLTNTELYYRDQLPDGTWTLRQDPATLAKRDKMNTVLLQYLKFRESQLARERTAATAAASSSVATNMPSLTAASVLAKTAACMSVDAFGPDAMRDARPSEVELFRRAAPGGTL